MATTTEIKTLNEMWAKLATFLGFRSQAPLTSLLVSSTTEPKVLYVASTGQDSNPGTQDAPFKTIQAAIDSLPEIIRHTVTISVGVGNFAGFAISGFTMDRLPLELPGAWINVVGTLVNATVSTGTATGTVSSATGLSAPCNFATVTDSTQTWTVNEHQGKMIEILTGTGAGNKLQIVSNTSTAVTVAGNPSPAIGAGATYAIRDWGTVINSGVATDGNIGLPGSAGAGGCVAIYNNIASATASRLQIQDMKLTPSTSAAARIEGFPTCSIVGCSISTTGSISGLIASSRMQLSNTNFINTGSGSLCLLSSSISNTGFGGHVSGCYFKGGAGGIIAIGNVSLSTTAFEGQSSSALTTGVKLFISQSSYVRITGNGSSAGVRSSNVSAGNGQIHLNLSGGWEINNCGNAIWFEGPESVVSANGAGGSLTGTGNTNGFRIGYGARIQYVAASTLTGSVSEIILEGNVTTIAAMRAASPKVISSLYGTYFYE